MNNKLEIELRAKIDPKVVEELLSRNKIQSESTQHDIYYKFISTPENSWIVRIREENRIYTLTYKSQNQKSDGAWSEVEMEIEKVSAQSLHHFFLQNGYNIEVQISKRRVSYTDNGLTVNIDDIQGLGTFIEVELFAKKDEISNAHKKLSNYLEKIGVSSEDITKKGYVTLMKEVSNNERN